VSEWVSEWVSDWLTDWLTRSLNFETCKRCTSIVQSVIIIGTLYFETCKWCIIWKF
jgi:hypothetical protein